MNYMLMCREPYNLCQAHLANQSYHTSHKLHSDIMIIGPEKQHRINWTSKPPELYYNALVSHANS